MAIWFNKNLSLDEFYQWRKDTMVEHIDINFIEIGENWLKATMPVDNRTRQAYGILHGGASVTLAETIGSVASALIIDPEKFICVGLEINANHIRSVRSGLVIATCTPIHLGRSTHVWDIKINDENEKLVCVSRLTVAILEKKK